MSLLEVLLAVVIAVGIIGVLVPVLPGTLLVLAAVLVWAVDVGGSTAWTVFAVAVTVLALGAIVKYAVPGRRLQDAGIPGSTLAVGGALGLVGFFVVPVVGLLLGFVLGVYLAEHRRVGASAAWPSTVHALKAAGLSILIELLAAMMAAATWAVGVVVT
ncbi:DUF456 domain-containing protein [Nocardioides abyssi]|uniref:DUF456 domain-containing protein n=1 Tax=Nocardioides abyssi TaxID=3058370 RepID=A0ABT8EY16_9ACTN|nr:DUF456 domain-containing protein [Nocardioides abyssi]MDN4163095.1 DUF456 domain-containing protein [Nocardioides abyssi]